MLILTHEHADFDAVASQLAAHKLYPEGVPLLSRRVNRNVRQFLTLYWGVLPFIRPEEWRRQRVEEVILVDTQSLSSVRGLVRQPRVRVIDHHLNQTPQPEWIVQVEAVGANTTLLVEKLQLSGLVLTAEEATLLLLGIYEDTGSLTYDTTTARDARAAAWLLEQDAQLAVVRRFLNVPLNEAQQALYETLQKAAKWITVNEQPVVVAAATAPEGFADEISSVVHRLRDQLSASSLFVLVALGRDVQLVARSVSDYVDVSLVARALGGGGHNRAAAALVVGQSLTAVLQQVQQLLPQAVKPMAQVRHIMSYGVQIVPPTLTVGEAAVLMRRFGYEGYPVVEPEQQRLVGLLTRRAVDRAMDHDLARLPVSRIMKAGSVTVLPSDSVERVQQLMLNEGWGQIPVVANDRKMVNGEMKEHEMTGRLIGIVTRTDVLNYLFKPSPETAESNLRQLLLESLAPPLWAMVLAVGAIADTLNMPLYFVGGPVRDLLLGKPPTDLDMVVEGDAIVLARHLTRQYGGEVHTHARFGTAKWFVTPAIWEAVTREMLTADADKQVEDVAVAMTALPSAIDFVTARTEFYTEPSALPEVERGSIKLDLHRRDFTINTLAVRLDGAHLGELLDFYGGRRDLTQGIIRVLHSLSFVDDPTRILRAVRLEQRLHFTIEPRTAELMTAALPMLERVTGDRIRHEIELALREADPTSIMERLAELDVLSHIHPQLTWPPDSAAAFQHVSTLLADPLWRATLQDESPAFVYFALWMISLSVAVSEAVMNRLRVRKATRDDVRACVQALTALSALPPDARPSQVEKVLRPYRPRVLLVVRAALGEELAAAQASTQSLAQWVEQYYREWRLVKTAVTGDDLRAMKLKPGPRYTAILDRLLAARLDGEVTDEAGERALLATLLDAKHQTVDSEN